MLNLNKFLLFAFSAFNGPWLSAPYLRYFAILEVRMLMNRRDSTADFVGRHCYCPDLFLSASDIVRTGDIRNCPHLLFSASDFVRIWFCPSLLKMQHLQKKRWDLVLEDTFEIIPMISSLKTHLESFQCKQCDFASIHAASLKTLWWIQGTLSVD